MSSRCRCAGATTVRSIAVAINPDGGRTDPARALWLQTHPLPTASNKKRRLDGAISPVAVGTDPRTGKRDRPIRKRGQKYRTKPITAAGPQ